MSPGMSQKVFHRYCTQLTSILKQRYLLMVATAIGDGEAKGQPIIMNRKKSESKNNDKPERERESDMRQVATSGEKRRAVRVAVFSPILSHRGA